MRNIEIISSKSDAHRALICSYLSDKPCNVIYQGGSADIDATGSCMKELIRAKNNNTIAQLHCKESGSTLRFILPIAAALGVQSEFTPEGRLPERPLSPLYEELEKHGCTMSPQGSVPFRVSGQLQAGTFEIPGNVSSQFISGLLFALPLLDDDSVIKINGELQSEGYVNMTEQTIRKFGISFEHDSGEIRVPGGQKYHRSDDYQVEGDWSNAAFWLALGVFGDESVSVSGLSKNSSQGDEAIFQILNDFGAKVYWSDDTNVDEWSNDVSSESDERSNSASSGSDERSNSASSGSDELAEAHCGTLTGKVIAEPSRDKLHGITIDARNIPDLVPVLSLVAALADGKTVITHAERLKLKESDRLLSTSRMLGCLGVDVDVTDDGLIIYGNGGKLLNGGVVDGFNDHRIVMTAAVASTICRNPVEIIGSEAVNKSYPTFFDELKENVDVFNIR